jgi:murein peptide amidase A
VAVSAPDQHVVYERRRGGLTIAAAALTAALLALLLAASAASAGRVVIGKSLAGRPIDATVRGSHSANRKILIVGCIHGNECAGRRIVSALAHGSVDGGVQLWLVPTINPDGAAADTRGNGHEVDLNRNFPYRWKRVPGPIYYSGPRPASEPETHVAMRLIRRIKPTVTVWYHQAEDLVDMSGGDRGVARRYARVAQMRATCLPFLPGTATAWSNHDFPGTAAFVVELPSGAVSRSALRNQLRAVHAMERGERVGSAKRCAG